MRPRYSTSLAQTGILNRARDICMSQTSQFVVDVTEMVLDSVRVCNYIIEVDEARFRSLCSTTGSAR